jgi:hypothetical protein
MMAELALDARLQQSERCTPGQRIAYKVPGGKVFLEVKVQRISGAALGDCLAFWLGYRYPSRVVTLWE